MSDKMLGHPNQNIPMQTYNPNGPYNPEAYPQAGYPPAYNNQPYSNQPYNNPNPIIIVNQNSMNDAIYPQNIKSQPNTVLQAMNDGSLSSNARVNFIKKVYMLLTAQLGFTIGICCISFFVPGFFTFQRQKWWVSIIAIVISAISMIIVYCYSRQMRSPLDLTLLFVFTGSFSYCLSQTTTWYALQYGGPMVIQALVFTAVIIMALTLYCFAVRTDFSVMIGILLVVVVSFILFGITFAFTWNSVLYNLYCTLGVILAGILLVIDTQMICDGQRGIGLDNYVVAALIIYMDAIRLFLWILRAMGSRK